MLIKDLMDKLVDEMEPTSDDFDEALGKPKMKPEIEAIKIEDTHNSVTIGASWKFTAPTSGLYEVSAMVLFTAGGGWVAGESAQLALYKNNSDFSRLGINFLTTTYSSFLPVNSSTRIVRMVAGDFIDIRVYQDSGASLALNTGATSNWVSIKRIGL